MGKKRIIAKSEEILRPASPKLQRGEQTQAFGSEAQARRDPEQSRGTTPEKPSIEPASQEILAAQSSHQHRQGRIYIFSSYNNTKMSLTDPAGNVLSNVSAGAIGFKGARKSTPFAASKVAETLSATAKNKGIDKVEILIKGIGSGRESALRSFATKGIEILSIRDVTPVPHNGPRPRKVRRV